MTTTPKTPVPAQPHNDNDLEGLPLAEVRARAAAADEMRARETRAARRRSTASRVLLVLGLVVALAMSASLCAGCGSGSAPSYPEKPGQAEAVALVWNAYGMAGHQPPAIDWVEGDRLDCTVVGFPGFTVRVGGVAMCAGGWTHTDTWTIQAQWTGSFSSGPLAHELAHAWLKLTTGSSDGGIDHGNTAGPIWGAGGDVEVVNGMLRAAGL